MHNIGELKGLKVRVQATIHDFMLLNSLATSTAQRGAVTLATAWLRQGFSESIL